MQYPTDRITHTTAFVTPVVRVMNSLSNNQLAVDNTNSTLRDLYITVRVMNRRNIGCF